MPKAQNICKNKGCKTIKASGKNFCHKCIKRKYRENNPMQAAYQNWKSNSKRRGIIFEISFEYFKKFCVQTQYLKGKGITKDSYSIDRIIDELGYIEGNIRRISLSKNVKKEHKRRKVLSYDYISKRGNYFELKPVDKDVPF